MKTTCKSPDLQYAQQRQRESCAMPGVDVAGIENSLRSTLAFILN
jgi:hypothetical protein